MECTKSARDRASGVFQDSLGFVYEAGTTIDVQWNAGNFLPNYDVFTNVATASGTTGAISANAAGSTASRANFVFDS